MISSLDKSHGETLRAFIDGAARWELINGESLSLLTQMPSACVDAVITDGPYSSGGQFRGDRAKGTGAKYVNKETLKRERAGTIDARADFEGDSRDQRSFIRWATLWSAECYRVAKPGAIVGLWTDWRQLPATSDALQAGGWVWRGTWVWDKTEGCRPQGGRPRAQCEYVLWGSKGPMSINRVGGRVEPGLVRVAATLSSKRGHQTGKPDAANRLWARLCEPGGIVLDPFAGSASMGDACIAEGRRYLGFELVPSIHTDARARLAGLGQSRRAQQTIWDAISAEASS